jgi:outer membrane protein TolC
VGLVVGFNLPIYRGKLDAAVREAEARVVADARRYEDLRDQTYEEVRAAYAEARGRLEVLDLFRSAYLPRSRQALEVAAADYRTGDLDFLSLNTAWRELLQVEVQIARSEAELNRALADLERAVGTQIAGDPAVPLAPIGADEPPPPPGEPGPFEEAPPGAELPR